MRLRCRLRLHRWMRRVTGIRTANGGFMVMDSHLECVHCRRRKP